MGNGDGMSIATREAAELYPFKGSFTEHGNERTNLRREGYIAGRTAEKRLAEIEAAAKAMCDYDHRISAERGHLHIRPTWDSASESVRAIYRKYALMALTAARKAMTA